MATAAKAAPKTPVKAPTLGKMIDDMWAMREEKRVKDLEVKAIETKIALAEQAIMEKLDAEDTITGKGKAASVSITEVTSFNITDFDIFAKYVAKTKYFHLFQRRVSEVAVREIFEQKGAVPGLTPFNKRKLNLRSLATKA